MMKYLTHASIDKAIFPSLRLAVVANFYPKFMSANPEPRKMWVASALATICPLSANHLKELEDENIPLSSLSGKQMMGSLLIVDVTDISNETDQLDDRSKAIWQARREEADKEGYLEAHVVLAKLSYWNQTLLMVPFAVSRDDLVFFGRGGRLENPRMLRELNAAINRETAMNPKKWVCLLGEDDKKHTRDRALGRKAWEAKHGVKAASCV